MQHENNAGKKVGLQRFQFILGWCIGGYCFRFLQQNLTGKHVWGNNKNVHDDDDEDDGDDASDNDNEWLK